jgi:hypothetical protein
VICEIHKENIYESGNCFKKEVIECTYSMRKALLFQKAMKTKSEESMKVLREELIKAIKLDI